MHECDDPTIYTFNMWDTERQAWCSSAAAEWFDWCLGYEMDGEGIAWMINKLY